MSVALAEVAVSLFT